MVGGDRAGPGRRNVVGMVARPPGDPAQPASSAPSTATATMTRPGPAPGQPVHRRAGQQGRADQPEQGQPVGLAEDRQPGDPDEPGVGHQHRDPHALPDLRERHVQVMADVQHRPERQRGAAQPEQQRAARRCAGASAATRPPRRARLSTTPNVFSRLDAGTGRCRCAPARSARSRPAAARARTGWAGWPPRSCVAERRRTGARRRPRGPAGAWRSAAGWPRPGAATAAAASDPAAGPAPRPGRACRPASRSATRAARIRAITADSWLTRTEAPSTTPRITPRPMVGSRRSRTAASRVSGRNTVPYTMFRWYQAW